jgi:hypothetical protein
MNLVTIWKSAMAKTLTVKAYLSKNNKDLTKNLRDRQVSATWISTSSGRRIRAFARKSKKCMKKRCN